MTQKQTISTILALVVSIAITMIPTVQAEESTNVEAILAEIAEREVLMAALSADNIVLEQSISDREDTNSDFETAKTEYQAKVDSKSIRVEALNDRLATFADPLHAKDERAYNGLQQTILDIEEMVAVAQGIVDLCVSKIATNDAIIYSAEMQKVQNSDMIVDLEQRLNSLYEILESQSN